MIWIRTQDGSLINLDHIEDIHIDIKDGIRIVAKAAENGYVMGVYETEEEAVELLNNLASWINKPTNQCVFFMPEKEER